MSYKGSAPLDINTLLREIQLKKDALITTEDNLLRVEVPSEKTLYFFTQPGHPAHSSVIIRRVVSEDGKVKIKTKGFTASNQPLFEQWLKHMATQDQQIKADFNN